MKYLIVILSLALGGCCAKVGDRKERKDSPNYKVVITQNGATSEYFSDFKPSASENYIYIYPIEENIRCIYIRADTCIVYDLRK